MATSCKRVSCFIELIYSQPSRPTAGVSRLGWERGLAVETEKAPSREKAPNNAARTPSRLHAVLGSLYADQPDVALVLDFIIFQKPATVNTMAQNH